MIGAGVIGSTTAWHLAGLGHQVILIDPILSKPINRSNPISGSQASLGILMGYVFRNSQGRSWQLRKRSMELWPHWITALSTPEQPLSLQTPLIQLARSNAESEKMKKLCSLRTNLGLNFLSSNSDFYPDNSWPSTKYGGLISNKDGRVNPISLLKALQIGLKKRKVKQIKQQVSKLIKRQSITNNQWQIHLDGGETISQDTIIICASIGTNRLIEPLGYSRKITPVLGQVIQLIINNKKDQNWETWPAAISYNGINLIPYGTNQILMGATLEPGLEPDPLQLKTMQMMGNNPPEWIREALIVKQWYGLRGRPVDRGAPILEQLEQGLILASGHYRNGILLAPATAEWVGNQLIQ